MDQWRSWPRQIGPRRRTGALEASLGDIDLNLVADQSIEAIQLREFTERDLARLSSPLAYMLKLQSSLDEVQLLILFQNHFVVE